MRVAWLVGLLGLTSGACVSTPSRGEPVETAKIGPLSFVGGQVAFDHPCDGDRVRVIRSQGATVDLDVCGLVRRYKAFANGYGGSTWLDVTSLYPAGSLPKSLPPE